MWLLIQAKYILENKDLNTTLEGDDLKFVKDVQNGKFSYPELIQIADKMDIELGRIYEESTLRHSPDFNSIEAITISICNALV